MVSKHRCSVTFCGQEYAIPEIYSFLHVLQMLHVMEIMYFGNSSPHFTIHFCLGHLGPTMTYQPFTSLSSNDCWANCKHQLTNIIGPNNIIGPIYDTIPCLFIGPTWVAIGRLTKLYFYGTIGPPVSTCVNQPRLNFETLVCITCIESYLSYSI